MSIRFPTNKFLKHKYSEFSIIIIIFLFNLIYYIPIPIIFFQVFSNFTVNSNKSMLTSQCPRPLFIYTMDIINLALMPFFLMCIFSILLIFTIFKSRLKMIRIRSQQNRRKLLKDIKFAISSIVLNVT